MGKSLPLRFPAPPLDWLEYAARQVADQQLHCVIAFNGQVDVERMAHAVRLTVDAEPVLGSRFVPDPRGPYWERRSDLDNLSLCQVIGTSDVERAAWDWIGAPLDFGSDPVVQVRIWRSHRDLLCVKMDHVAADAGGVKEYAYLLGRVYHALAANPRYVPAPNVWNDRGMGQVFKHASPCVLFKARPWRSMPDPQWGFPGSRGDLGDRAFSVRVIDAERLRSIRACAQAHKATVNDVLLAAEFRALGTMVRPRAGERLALQVSLDLRRYLPSKQGAAIANLASALFPLLEWRPEAPFEDTLRQARDAMNTFKANGPGLGSALFLQVGASLLGFARLEQMIVSAMAEGAVTGKSHPFINRKC